MKRLLTTLSLCIAGWIIPLTVDAQCSASFTWSQTQNNQIAFSGTVLPATANVYWNFGDQSNWGYQANTTHTYNVPGTYSVCMYVSDSLTSCQTQFCDTITVTGNVICTLNGQIYGGTSESCSGCADGSLSTYVWGGTAPYSYSWSNGGTGSSITGLTAGTYVVTITDAAGCTLNDTAIVQTIPPNACQPSFTWSQSQNNIIDFVNTSSAVASPNYFWDFGDQTSTWGPTNPSHTYSTPGTYIVCVTVSDSAFLCQNTFCDTITVTGTVICNMTLQTTLVVSESCVGCADAQASVTPVFGTAPYAYIWSNGDSGQTATGLTTGSYSVCVTDANGCSACDSITIGTCAVSFTWSQTQNNQIDFVATSNAPNSIYWNFGDGYFGYGTTTAHFYGNPGVYLVCVSVYDSSANCQATFCDSIIVTGAPAIACDANFSWWLDSTQNNLLWIWNQSTGSPTMQYNWSWGDNTFSTGQFPTHSYTQTGLFNICLTVYDSISGCTDSLCIPIQVARLAQQSTVPFTVNVIGGALSVNDPVQEETTWSIFPNPADQELQIQSSQTLTGRQFRILDITGRTLQQATVTGTSLDINDLTSGLYILQIENDRGGFSTQRFLKK